MWARRIVAAAIIFVFFVLRALRFLRAFVAHNFRAKHNPPGTLAQQASWRRAAFYK